MKKMFKIDNKDTKTTSIDIVVVVSLVLILSPNIIHVLF